LGCSNAHSFLYLTHSLSQAVSIDFHMSVPDKLARPEAPAASSSF
jgi:hypothetical protein